MKTQSILSSACSVSFHYVTKSSRVKCDALCNLGSFTIWHLHGRSNACECMLTLFIPSCRFYLFAWVNNCIRTDLWNGKRLNAIQMGEHYQSNYVWMLLPDFIVSWELQYNVIIHCTTSCRTLICSAVQCFH